MNKIIKNTINKPVCIVVALEKEAESFIEKANLKERRKVADKKTYYGEFNGNKIVLTVSGIGKVSAALSAQALIDGFSPRVVLNFGAVGGCGNVAAKNYYAVEKCCQYDFDLSELDNVSVGYIQDYDRVFFDAYTKAADFLEKRALATSDRFTCKASDVETIKKLGCALFDMEGAAIAQVCASNGVPFCSIKGVTDVYGSGANSVQFQQNLKAVSDGFADIIEKVLNNL